MFELFWFLLGTSAHSEFYDSSNTIQSSLHEDAIVKWKATIVKELGKVEFVVEETIDVAALLEPFIDLQPDDY